MGWLNDHMSKFVAPVLGYQPSSPAQSYFTPEEMTVIKNLWRSAKAKAAGRPILLPGRDVWVFEVLARRENFPTVFRPDISRLTAPHVTEDYSGHFVFDTGYAGSIPRILRAEKFSLASGINQAFPKLTGSRSLVLKIENSPKYWQRGFWRPEQGIMQELSERDTFIKAAQLTIEIYKSSAPKFINSVKPVGNGHNRWQSFSW